MGWLHLLHEGQRPSPPELRTLERAAAAVAISLLSERESGARASQRQTALLNRLLLGDITGERCATLGLALGQDLRGRDLVVVTAWAGDEEPTQGQPPSPPPAGGGLAGRRGRRPHIDPVRPHTAVNRRTLRQIMAVGLEDVLHFGRTASGYEADEDGVRLLFEDGSSATGDVLVAADGINSVVRGQLLPEVPVVDTGLRGLYAIAPLTDSLAAALPDRVFDGFSMAWAPNGAVLVAGVYQPRRPVAEAVAELAPGAAVDPVGPYVMAGLFAPPHGDLFPGYEELRRATSEARHAV
ncbi:hypothetical protein [Streptomyces scabiei]|uniref:hypothetical protein n=1 Tax=Streptomyces scabiei TaxID=1930 RepID=UPI001F16BF0F|nr:hypothetical protein [Streptomyces scabiei]